MVSSVEGRFYPSGSSRSVAATLCLSGLKSIEVRFLDGVEMYSEGGYVIEPPLGSLDRVVHFKNHEGDSRFETSDVEGFRELELQLGSGKVWALISQFEGRWRWALSSVLALALLCIAFFQWGLPALAWVVANDMPQSWRAAISRESLETMERLSYISPSKLEIADRERVQQLFNESLVLAGIDESEYEYELVLFEGKGIGANAFAFPSGLVIATDEFVELCESDEQIQAVFLHEIAHVELQHGIRGLIQKGGVFLVFSLLVGDASSAISLAEGIPAMVMNSQYSQRFEMESDTFAAQILEESGIGAEAMGEILVLLHKDVPDVPVATFLSTHPSLRERVENVRRIQAGEALE